MTQTFVVGVDEDVGGVEVPVYVRDVVIVVRRQGVVGQELRVELADVRQHQPPGKLQHLPAEVCGEGGDAGPDRRSQRRGEPVVLEKRHPLVTASRVQRAEDLIKCAAHDRNEATRRHVGSEQRLQRPDLGLAHRGVGVLQAGPVAQVDKTTDTGRVVAEYGFDLLEGDPLLGDGAVRGPA